MKKNIAALIAIQAVSLFSPLVIVSLLGRRLGIDGFGEYSTAIAFGAYFSVAVEWGFSLTATRRVAIADQDIFLRSRIFFEVIWGRFTILMPLCIIFIFWVVFFDLKNWLIYLFAALPSICGVVNANFLFQGLESMQRIVVGTIFAKLLPIPLVYIFIHSPGDELWAVMIVGVSTSLTFAYGFFVAVRHKLIYPVHVAFSDIEVALREGFGVFFSGSVMVFFVSANVLLLGRFHNYSEVGNFSAAQNLIKAVCSVYAPISQALFPRMVSGFERRSQKINRNFLLLLVLQGAFGMVLSAVVFFFGSDLLVWYFGPAYKSATDVVKWLSLLPFLLAVSNVLGIQYLVPNGLLRYFSGVMYFSALCGLVAGVACIPSLGSIGSAFSLVLAELVVALLMAVAVAIFIRRKDI
jgi:O-antigen/teichoic acid export membrane protein